MLPEWIQKLKNQEPLLKGFYCCSDVFRAIDVEAFMGCFVKWTKEIAYKKSGQHKAIDGKAIRTATKNLTSNSIFKLSNHTLLNAGQNL